MKGCGETCDLLFTLRIEGYMLGALFPYVYVLSCVYIDPCQKFRVEVFETLTQAANLLSSMASDLQTMMAIHSRWIWDPGPRGTALSYCRSYHFGTFLEVLSNYMELCSTPLQISDLYMSPVQFKLGLLFSLLEFGIQEGQDSKLIWIHFSSPCDTYPDMAILLLSFHTPRGEGLYKGEGMLYSEVECICIYI